MLGRGGESTYHGGNIAFRQLVEQHKTKYYTCPRANKSRVVAEVVRKWRNMNPPGRFLTRTSAAVPGETAAQMTWEDVGDRRALKKASHSLRDSVRCFSIEKKQQRQKTNHKEGGEDQDDGEDYDDRRVISDESSGSGDNNNNRTLTEEPTLSVHQHIHRKRGRIDIIMDPALMSSGCIKEQRKQQAPLANVPIAGATEMAATLALLDERPSKMRRVICDEREEAEGDCRRGGSEEGDGRRGGGDVCFREGRDGSGSVQDPYRRVREPSRNQVVSIPQSIWVGEPSNTGATLGSWREQSGDGSASFSWNPASLPKKPSAPVQQLQTALDMMSAAHKQHTMFAAHDRLYSNPSPCESAEWFAGGVDELPVQGPSHDLPTAAVLVNEQQPPQGVVENQHQDPLDDDSLGWYTDDEDNGLEFAAYFSKPVSFAKPASASFGSGRLDVHRPVPMANTNVSSAEFIHFSVAGRQPCGAGRE